MTQGFATYPLSRPLPTAARRGGTLAYACAATLAAWLVSLMFPFLWVREWDSLRELAQEGADFRYYYFAGFAVACVAHLTLGISAWFSAPLKILSIWSGRLITAFFAVALLVSPLSLVPKASAVYSVATWGVYLTAFLYWQSDYRITQRMTVLAGYAVYGWLFFLMAKLGVSVGYAIGGINRNTSATAALGGLACCMVSSNRNVRWAAVAIAAFMAFVVNSRGSIVAMGAFMCVYYLLNKGTFRAVAHSLLVLSFVGTMSLVLPHLLHFATENIMLLHDRYRGIGSGFTGRWDLWKQALDSFWKHPIFGYGFRVSSQGGGGDYGGIHSGYLKLLVETGIVGTFLAVSAILIEGVRRFRVIAQIRDLPQNAVPGIDIAESVRINSVACATLAMTLTFWVYEQLYINLGSTESVVFLLMMVAPLYITSQGQPMYKLGR